MARLGVRDFINTRWRFAGWRGPIVPALSLSEQEVTIIGTTATVTWASSNPGSSRVDHKLTSSGTWIEGSVSVGPTSTHSRQVSGLTPEAAYDFRGRTVDFAYAQEALTTVVSMTVPAVDVTAPTVLTGPTASPGPYAATVSVTTNEAAKLQIEYGLTNSYGSTAESVLFSSSPAVSVLSLTANTLYNWRARAVDGSGNASAWSTNATFTTLAAPVASAWPGDVAIPAGFPNSTTTGLPDGWTPSTTIVGDYTVNGGVLEDYEIFGKLTVNDGATVRRCRVHGNQTLGNNGQHVFGLQINDPGTIIEDCDLGPEVLLCVLAADIEVGDLTVDIDHSGTEFAATGFPVDAWNVFKGNNTYLMFCQESPANEQYRTISDGAGKTNLGNGIWRYELGENYGDPSQYGWRLAASGWRSPWAGFRFPHAAGSHISYHRWNVEWDPNTNTLGGTTTGNLTGWHWIIRRCNVHGGGDGMKGGGTGTNVLVQDTYIHDFWYMNGAHNDGFQKVGTGHAAVIHNSIIGTYESVNAIRMTDNSTKGTAAFNYVSASFTAMIGFNPKGPVEDKGTVMFNRFGHTLRSPTQALQKGSIPNQTVDNRWARTGGLSDGGGTVTGGAIIPGGDTDGNGTGAADAWGDGYADHPFWNLDGSYALPQNPEYTP